MSLRDSGHEPVADAGFGDQVLGLGRIVFDLLAQLAHVDTQVVRVVRMAWSPHRLQQLPVGEHAVRMRRHVDQQAVFDRGHVQVFAIALDGAARQIDLHVAELDHAAAAAGQCRAAAQVRAHAGQQFAHREGLDQVVVGAGVEGLDLVGLVDARRQHEDGDVRPAAQFADQIDAVAIGQAEVEHHQVGAARAGFNQSALHCLSLMDLEAVALKRLSDEAADLRFVFDHENPRRGFAHPASPRTSSFSSASIVGGSPRGNSMTKRAPPPGRVWPTIVPPWASTMARSRGGRVTSYCHCKKTRCNCRGI